MLRREFNNVDLPTLGIPITRTFISVACGLLFAISTLSVSSVTEKKPKSGQRNQRHTDKHLVQGPYIPGFITRCKMHRLIRKFCFHGSPKRLYFEGYETTRWTANAGNYLNAPLWDQVTLVQDNDTLTNRATISYGGIHRRRGERTKTRRMIASLSSPFVDSACQTYGGLELEIAERY